MNKTGRNISVLAWVGMLTIGMLAASSLWAEQGRHFGDGADGGDPVAIAEILAKPESFEGRDVQVTGKVSDVCPKKGCWMELRDEQDAGLRVKVEDDVIVFPQDAKGKTAVARGVVRILKMDRAEYLGWMQHLAEERGEVFDESTLGDGPYQIVQLAGTGAQLKP